MMSLHLQFMFSVMEAYKRKILPMKNLISTVLFNLGLRTQSCKLDGLVQGAVRKDATSAHAFPTIPTI